MHLDDSLQDQLEPYGSIDCHLQLIYPLMQIMIVRADVHQR